MLIASAVCAPARRAGAAAAAAAADARSRMIIGEAGAVTELWDAARAVLPPTRAETYGLLLVEAAVRGEQRREVLAWLERRHSQRIRPAEICVCAGRDESLVDTGVRDMDRLRGDPERLDDVIAREARVDHHDVAGARCVAVLRTVHAPRALVYPLGEVQRHEVVHHRRAYTRPLRWVHPVAEVENVERAEHALRGRPAGAAPKRAQRMRRGQDGQPLGDVDAGECSVDFTPAATTCGRKRNELVLSSRRLDEAAQRASHVVANARSLVRQGRDVDNDSHCFGCT